MPSKAKGPAGHSVLRTSAVMCVWSLIHQNEAPQHVCTLGSGSNTSASERSDPFLSSFFGKSPFLSTLSQDWAQSPARGCWKLAPRHSAAHPPPAGSVLSSGALPSLPFPRAPPPPARVSGHKHTTFKKPTSHRKSPGWLWGHILVFSFWATMGRVVGSCFHAPGSPPPGWAALGPAPCGPISRQRAPWGVGWGVL